MIPTFRNLLSAAGLLAALLAGPVAVSAHTFNESRTAALQIERDHAVLVVGYQPGSGGGTLGLVAHAAARPKAMRSQALRAILAARAMSAISVEIDGARAIPASIESRMFVDPPGSDRLAVAVMLIYDLPPGRSISRSGSPTGRPGFPG